MDTKARNELESIKRELNSIIRELEAIERGVRYDFVGIGNDLCANCIGGVADRYRTVKRKLDNIDTTTVTEGFVSGGGSGGGGGGIGVI